MYAHLLVPIDETELGAELVSDAIDLARRFEARVSFLHVAAGDEASLYGDAAVLRAVAPERFIERYRWTARSVLARAEAGARAAGVPCRVVTADAHGALHEVILAAARDGGCDLIVMASHARSSRLATLVRSNAVAVMTRSNIPFLLAVPGAAGADPMRRVLTRIRDEHRTIAAVVEGLLRLLPQDRAQPLASAEQRIVQASLRFLGDFAGRQHHPKEEEYLFSKLSTACGELAVTLGELRHQHRLEQQLLEAAAGAVAGECHDVRSAVEALARHVMRHMEQEEERVLPWARTELSAADWVQLDGAFAGHTDPRFAADTEQARRAMYARLVNQLPH
jgi:nucleotide-binding universal stress UspA family protein/hemerythrin-like domain-containing protein